MLLSFCLFFYQFQPGVAYESVAYKKAYIRSDLVRFKNILCLSKMPTAIISLRRISSIVYENLRSLKKTQARLTQTQSNKKLIIAEKHRLFRNV